MVEKAWIFGDGRAGGTEMSVATGLDPQAAEKLRAIQSQLREKFRSLPVEQQAEAEKRYRHRNRMFFCYPERGKETDIFPHSRDKYPRHMEFYRSGRDSTTRAFVAANRVGKNFATSFEIAFHMTGRYPEWWEGYQFDKPQKWWIAHKTWKDVRDVNQAQLLGPPEIEGSLGTGSIPASLIHKTIPNPHIRNGFESFQVRHKSGGLSSAQFKAYEQGWQAFESHRINGAWLDEICPLDIYNSVKARTVNTEGGQRNDIVILTFTPVEGLSDLLIYLSDQAVNRKELPW